MKMFHVKRFAKTLLVKGFFVFFLVTSCVAPRATVEINSYVLMENGKEILGHDKGITAFLFENNQRKEPFVTFLDQKYKVGNYVDVEYWITIQGDRYKVLLYNNDEVEKYFDVTQFMVSNVETDANIRSGARFHAMSVINERNEDCLADNSLYKNIVVKYLEALKDEYKRD